MDASDDEYDVEAPTARMAAGEQWDGSVAYVDGDKIADWLQSRPADLRDERKEHAVREWLCALPQT
jgi:hypothetical protein